MNEDKIILALNEAKKYNEEDTPAGNSSLGGPRSGGMNFLYSCPECGEDFFVDASDLNNERVECPYCGKLVKPKFVKTMYDESVNTKDDDVEDDDVEECGDTDEAMVKTHIKFTNGKKTVIKGHKAKKLSPKAKQARRKALAKARRKSNTGSAKAKRAKSMRARAKLNSSLNIDENVAKSLLNTMLDDIFENCPQYERFNISKITRAVYNESSDNLVLNTDVKYDDGSVDTAKFNINGFKTENLSVNESTGILDIGKLDINGHGYLTESNLGLTSMEYSLTTDDNQSFTESFVVYR